MISIARTIFRVKAATSGNIFIYYLKRLPVIGKLISDSLYAEGALKNLVALFIFFMKQGMRFVMKGVFLTLMVALPAALMVMTANFGDVDFSFDLFRENLPMYREECLAYFSVILLLVSGVMGSLHDSLIFHVSQEKITCLKALKMRPGDYIRVSVGLHYLLHFLYTLPFLVLFMWILGASALQIVAMFLLLVSLRFCGEAFLLAFFEKTGCILCRKPVFSFLVYGCFGALAFVPGFVGVSMLVYAQVALSLPVAAGGTLLGAAAFRYVLFGYRNYSKKIGRTLETKYLASAQMKQSAKANVFANVSVREKDLNKTSDTKERFRSKSGYAYLQSLFFYRHKRQIRNPVAIRLAVIAGLFGAILFMRFFLAESLPAAEWTEMTGFVERLPSFLPTFVFVLYFLSVAEKACRAMFYNCDSSMLHYSYYREAGVILRNFGIRLRVVSGYNLLVALALNGAVVGAMFLFGVNIYSVDLLVFVLAVFVLSLFFSVHHLCMYYVLQPYTTQEGVRSPFYKFVNGAVYMLCFFSMQLETGNLQFGLIVLGATFVYILVALVLVYKLSPKRFRVK